VVGHARQRDGVQGPVALPVGAAVEAVADELARRLLLAFVALWQLRGLLRSVRHGDPFHTSNVRRLRQFGWLIMLGYPVVAFISSLLNEGLGSTMAAEQPLLGSEFDPHLGIALPTGLAVLVLAEVFAHGVRLREDIEGTI